MQAFEMNAPRTGSAPAFLKTSAANPLASFGNYGQAMGLGANLYGATYSSAFDAAGADTLTFCFCPCTSPVLAMQ
jgi:hypothetical protein